MVYGSTNRTSHDGRDCPCGPARPPSRRGRPVSSGRADRRAVVDLPVHRARPDPVHGPGICDPGLPARGSPQGSRVAAHGRGRPGPARASPGTGAAAEKSPYIQGSCGELCDSQEAGWRNPKQAVQWRNSLAAYVHPVFGSLPVDAVDTASVLKALQPIWFTKAETAGRVRARIQAVLDWAGARGLRQGNNPARWEGHLDKLLPRKSKVTKVEHHPALPFDELPGFMADLRKRPATAARALEFAILTGARTGEALGARWSEVDLHRRTWTVPADRMKAGREHRVPLSERAVELIQAMRDQSRGDVIFPAANGLRPLSNMALLMMLGRMKRQDLAVHGFRSTFRDWVAERTDFPGEVAEMALAHGVRNQVEAAYRRGDLFEKRRQLMDVWCGFATGRDRQDHAATTLNSVAEVTTKAESRGRS